MEIVVHIIKDLNRYLNLGIYLLVDSQKIMVLSLTLGRILREYNSSDSLNLYKDLTELKRLLTSWHNYYCRGLQNTAGQVAGQIYANYNFDINKHYEEKKYGTY